jgi:transposase-like protein
VLVELNVVEQRLKAVLEVLDGASVTDVARRYEVTRQSVRNWLRHHATDGFKGLVDKPSRPLSCPHQMRPEVEAMIVMWRRADGGLGPVSILNLLRDAKEVPLQRRSSVSCDGVVADKLLVA